jgi:hypothetical protein
MVSKGHFVLHSRAVPPLTAGDYVLEGDQRIDDGASGSYPTEPYRGHVRIRSPRYRMPPEQILSTFPPANAEGAFDSRLPQVVLKRRTLPWERAADPADRKVPWLALVVIAEGEGTLSGEVPVAECVTPGVTLAGRADVPTGVYLSVPKTVVTKVFPTKEDLELLAHVREVDIHDTELALGDDDGFLAVVMANRLPQFDRVACKPVRYLACLVSLEGQLDVLPPPTPPLDHFFPTDLVFNFDAEVAMATADLDHVIMGSGEVPGIPSGPNGVINPVGASGGAAPETIGAARASAPKSTASARATDDWRTGPAAIEALAASASSADAGEVVRAAMGDRFRASMAAFVAEKMFRFPVLAHWSFTSTGAGSFELLMQDIDVGMLGTVAGRPSGKPFPECFEPSAGKGPPEDPPARPAAELAETGHVGLPHVTRRGESLRAWYRGPFVPQLTRREVPEAGGRLPLAHVSDQLRELVPDGREDLGRACAFEIGRLLALSQPSVVAALLRWRGEQFGAARARRFGDIALGKVSMADFALNERNVAELGAMINRAVVTEAARKPQPLLGNSRPLVDSGRSIDVVRGDIEAIIARGFDMEIERVSAAIKTGDFSVLEALEVPVVAGDDLDDASLRSLSLGLDAVLGHLAGEAMPAREGPGPGPVGASRSGSAPPADRGGAELDRLLRAAAARVRKEMDR